MGLFSGVKNLVSKAAPAIGSAIGTWISPGVGTAVGGSLGSMAGKMLGGGEDSQGIDWGSLLGEMGGSALNQYMSSRNQKYLLGQADDASDLAYMRSLQGIQMQNASAKEIADAANAQSQYNAERQMSWQRQMSDSAHQREVYDLRAAGLNPILSGTGGMGASTPSGAQGSVQTAPVRSEGDAVSSALEAFKTMANALNTNAQTNYLSTAQTALTSAQTVKTRADTELTGAQTDVAKSNIDLNATRARLNRDQSLKIATEIQNLKELRDNIPKTGKLTDAQTAQVKQTTENLKQVFRELKVKGDISIQDQQYWNNLINQSGGSASGTLQLLNSLRQLVK